ncbi:hypothetical protein V6N11_074890 [Hibiscus sabdariffa]|uniref:Uncharacterized protein n=1 Tax=Hibiscus sabdariffa TaxID=183260 RepID=A0ABR2R4X2_9ROSI
MVYVKVEDFNFHALRSLVGKIDQQESMEEEVIVISSSSSEEDTRLSNITCKQELEDEEELKPHICLKKNTDLDMEDCFILDSNPFDSVDIAKLSITIDDDDDLSVVAEKGKVACRDYPHSRHLCVRFPFDKTPHEKHCVLRLHASFGKHIVMLRSMLSTGSLKGIQRY